MSLYHCFILDLVDILEEINYKMNSLKEHLDSMKEI